jgi:hypothetical protein
LPAATKTLHSPFAICFSEMARHRIRWQIAYHKHLSMAGGKIFKTLDSGRLVRLDQPKTDRFAPDCTSGKTLIYFTNHFQFINS